MLVKVVTKKFRVHCAVLNARTRQVWFAHVHRVTAVMARGKRPVPFRTRKLSLSAPMVLPWRRGGRVGRRRTIIPDRGSSIRAGAPVGVSACQGPRPLRPHVDPVVGAPDSSASRALPAPLSVHVRASNG